MPGKKTVVDMGQDKLKVCEGLTIINQLKIKQMRIVENHFNKGLSNIDWEMLNNMIPLLKLLSEMAGNKITEDQVENILDREIEEKGNLDHLAGKIQTIFEVKSKNVKTSSPKKK